ncbi:MAG: peptide chain release factor 2 [Candidatus Eisenbacteria bacterium]|uniref:Peptide chain release factor 2 n=1 Tax=Eiseniibacteriota bacterium TaxID=2212470 RepID=A0A538SKG6_UNCEI|nr:MAG: peptide chain release factor 2 [Candidatus Eisenbacteria bacterium]
MNELLLEELTSRVDQVSARVADLGGTFELEKKSEELKDLETRSGSADFWQDPVTAQKALQRRTRLGEEIEEGKKLLGRLEEAHVMLDLAREGEEVEEDLRRSVELLEREMAEAESQDWAEMLYRMYLRWAERKGFRVRTLEYQEGEEAGIKSATLLVEGKNAYGFLKAETGVHRLVRISPFDAAARPHTSFASVYVSPDIEDKIEIKIEEKDLRIDTYRSSGAGGQHVNVTDSAVRITHLPTGLVASCQNERSQHRNRDVAMKILRSRLYDMAQRERDEKRAAEEGAKKEIAWGSQIRSYVLQPYRLIKDHRTNLEIGNVDKVLDGDLDDLIRAYLLKQRDERA